MAGTTGMDWAKWLPLIMAGGATGAQLIGSNKASGQMNRANDLNQLNSQRMYDMAQQERQRRDMLTKMVMPNLMQGTGVSGGQARGYIGQMPSDAGTTSNTSSPAGPPAPVSVPQTPGSGVSKVAGGIGSGLGLAGMMGFGGPIGALAGGALLGGSAIANKIGQGHRTANLATGTGGFEKNFADALTRISSGQGTLADLKAARAAYDQNAQAWQAQGGKHKTVADQSLNNQDLQGTYQRLLAQLQGGANG